MASSSRLLIHSILVGVAIFLISSPTASAQDEEQVTAINDAFYQAFSNQDIERMAQLWSHGDEVRMIGPRAKSIVEGWSGVQSGWEGVFSAYDDIMLSMPNPQVRAGARVAWVVGIEEVAGTRSNGETFRASVMATNIFEKIDGEWLMVHHHVSLPAE